MAKLGTRPYSISYGVRSVVSCLAELIAKTARGRCSSQSSCDKFTYAAKMEARVLLSLFTKPLVCG